jgi:hypothetical protein
MRDLGETNVGGIEIIKNLKDNDGFGVKAISATRIQNVAKAYAWWIAKDCATLGILKVIKLNFERVPQLMSSFHLACRFHHPQTSDPRIP